MNCGMFNCISAPFQKLKSNNFVCKLSAEMNGLISQVPFEHVQRRCVALGINVKQVYTALMQDVLDKVKHDEAPSFPRQVEEISGTLVSDVVITNSHTVDEVGVCSSDTHDLTLEHIDGPKCDSLHEPKSDGVIMDFEGNAELEPPSSEITEVVSANGRILGSHDQVIILAPLSVESQVDSVAVESTNLIRAADAKSDILTSRPSVGSTISTESEHRYLDGEDVYDDNSGLIVQNDSNDTFESEDMVMTDDCPTKEGMSPAMSENDESCVVVDLDEALSAPENKGEPVNCVKYSNRDFFTYLKPAQEKKQNKAVSGEVHKLNQDSCEYEWEII